MVDDADDSDDAPTCGKGLAAHADIPRRVGELIAALADNLEQHLPAISGIDAASRGERAAYKQLAEQHREIARRLDAVSSEMASYRDLAMAQHDMTVLQAQPSQEAFERYIATLRATIVTLQRILAADEQLS